MCICVITHYFKVGGGTWGTVLYTVEVWVLGVGMSTPGAQTALYTEDRGLVAILIFVDISIFRGSDIGFR
jgi:hypothetical protein